MTDSHDDDTATTSRGRRQAAREKARLARQRQKRRARGARWAVIAGVGVVIVALVVGIVFVVVGSMPSGGRAPANMANGGITIGAGLKAVSADGPGASTASPTVSASASPSASASSKPSSKPSAKPSASATPEPTPTSTTGGQTVQITVYLDYLCPICGQFEKADNDYIEGLVRSGAATVEYHPIAILNNQSLGTKYSQRAANAGACVADQSPDSFFAFNTAMFANQPEEGTKGLTDAQLVSLVKGIDGVRHTSAISRCITRETFGSWVTDATQRALKGPLPGTSIAKVTGTPTVLVNGQQYKYSTPFTTEEFSNFVVTAAGNSYSDTATSSATPEPLPSNSKIGTPAK